MPTKVTVPWTYWIEDNFLDSETLAELKSIDHRSLQTKSGHRLSDTRFFITESSKDSLPNLYKFYQSLHNGYYKKFFEEHTNRNYDGLYPRVEIVSDFGSFYLERHHDLLEKKLSALVYTDFEELYSGTLIYNDTQEHHLIETKDNRCMFFNPDSDTWHGYPQTTFNTVRRCLMINYWSYQSEE